MTVLAHAKSRDDAAAFDAIATLDRTPADRLLVTQLAVVLARHTGARLQTHGSASDELASADVVVMSTSDANAHARRLLDSGTAVVVVPAQSRAVARIARIGIGYDGGVPAGSALDAASALVAGRPAEVEQVDVIHVDDSASAMGDAQEHVVSSRRSAVIAWWLERVAGQIPAPVRIVRSVGDPADELAQLSHQFDLLVVGTRGRAPLRRALTGSVSAKLMRTTRCPLLVVPPKRAALVSRPEAATAFPQWSEADTTGRV
jgi:nucleotide-binding universal stress UspA family protein